MTMPTIVPRIALITGVSGQDGSYLAELLLKKGYIVHGISRGLIASSCIPHLQACLGEGRKRLYLHRCDIVDYSSIYNLVRDIQPQEIYNLAAQSHVSLSFKHPELTAAANGLGVLNILEAILEAGLGESVRFFDASSCEIFGKGKGCSCDEESAMHPQTPYGKAKLLAHLAVKYYRDSFQMYVCSGILFSHESPRRGENFVTRKITLAVARIKLGKQESLSLGNLDSTRDWGHAREYVCCMWLMLQQQHPADFVISTGVSTTVRHFAELAFKRAGLPIRWRGPRGVDEKGVVAEGSQAGRTVVTISPHLFRPVEGALTGKSSRACTMLGWQHNTTIPLLVNEMVDADLATVSTADKPSHG